VVSTASASVPPQVADDGDDIVVVEHAAGVALAPPAAVDAEAAVAGPPRKRPRLAAAVAASAGSSGTLADAAARGESRVPPRSDASDASASCIVDAVGVQLSGQPGGDAISPTARNEALALVTEMERAATHAAADVVAQRLAGPHSRSRLGANAVRLVTVVDLVDGAGVVVQGVRIVSSAVLPLLSVSR